MLGGGGTAHLRLHSLRQDGRLGAHFMGGSLRLVTVARDEVPGLEQVDVIIATRGTRPLLLAEAVRSVVEQDYEGDVRIFVVYDCEQLPQDGLEVDRADAHRAVVRLTSNRPRGLAGARNAGVQAASASWVAFLDDDDLWMPGKLTSQIQLAATTGASVVTTGIEIVRTGGGLVARPTTRDVITHADLVHDRMAELHPSSFLLRREAVFDVGGVDEALPGSYAEDYDLLLRLARVKDIVAVRAPLTRVRWTGDSYFFSRWETIASALRYLLLKHPSFTGDAAGWGRVKGQIAFAEAAMGHRRTALREAVACVRRSPREPRAALAVAVAAGLISADQVQRVLHRVGRGI